MFDISHESLHKPNRASRKFYLTAAGNQTRDLRISRTMLYPLSYEAKLGTTVHV